MTKLGKVVVSISFPITAGFWEWSCSPQILNAIPKNLFYTTRIPDLEMLSRAAFGNSLFYRKEKRAAFNITASLRAYSFDYS